MTELASQVRDALARVPVAALLPARRAAGGTAPTIPVQLVSLLDLGPVSGGHAVHAVVEDVNGVRWGVPAVLDGSALRRATSGDGVAAALLEHAGHTGGPERPIDVDHSNDLVVCGGSVVKWLLHPGPDDVGAQRLESLARQGFAGVPPLVAVVRSDGDVIAVVTAMVAGAIDGWEWMVDDVRSAAAAGGRIPVDEAERLGRLVADLHAACAAEGVAFAGAADLRAWLDGAAGDIVAAGLGGQMAVEAQSALSPMAEVEGAALIPIHGDLHVGQVLRDPEGGLTLVDFDGHPLLSEEERLAPAPAARDVAGMAASIDHVGRVVLHRTPGLTESQRALVDEWTARAPAAFVAAYRGGLAAAGCADLYDDRLLLPFLVQQECREYAYAAQYLPHWRYVPDAALPPLLERARLERGGA